MIKERADLEQGLRDENRRRRMLNHSAIVDKRHAVVEANKLAKLQQKAELEEQKEKERVRSIEELEKQKVQKLKYLIAHSKAKENYAIELANKKMEASGQYTLRQDKIDQNIRLHQHRIQQLEQKELQLID